MKYLQFTERISFVVFQINCPLTISGVTVSREITEILLSLACTNLSHPQACHYQKPRSKNAQLGLTWYICPLRINLFPPLSSSFGGLRIPEKDTEAVTYVRHSVKNHLQADAIENGSCSESLNVEISIFILNMKYVYLTPTNEMHFPTFGVQRSSYWVVSSVRNGGKPLYFIRVAHRKGYKSGGYIWYPCAPT